MEKPLAPVLWIACWSRVWYLACLHIADEDEETEEIDLLQFFLAQLFEFFLREGRSADKFLSNVGCFFAFIFF
jgi:hypothetical protein